jgi:SAM-dependent methyltransferase
MTSSLYKKALEVYFKFKPHQTEDFENYWRNRTIGKDWHYSQNNWLEGYWKSANHPHRKLLIDTILRHEPLSVLEIGCNVGVNLYLLNKSNPKILCAGFDINRMAVDYGIYKMRREMGMNEVWMWCMAADEMSKLKTLKNFDVIFSDAALIYIGDDKIDKVMSQVGLRAKKAVVFCERHINYGEGVGVYKDGLWNRDYFKLINEHCDQFTHKKDIKITNEIWPEWSETGHIIEAWR